MSNTSTGSTHWRTWVPIVVVVTCVVSLGLGIILGKYFLGKKCLKTKEPRSNGKSDNSQDKTYYNIGPNSNSPEREVDINPDGQYEDLSGCEPQREPKYETLKVV